MEEKERINQILKHEGYPILGEKLNGDTVQDISSQS